MVENQEKHQLLMVQLLHKFLPAPTIPQLPHSPVQTGSTVVSAAFAEFMQKTVFTQVPLLQQVKSYFKPPPPRPPTTFKHMF